MERDSWNRVSRARYYPMDCLVLFSIIICLLPGCVKDPQDIPSGLSEDPVFAMQGTFNGKALDIAAGRGAWTMLPVVEEHDNLLVYSAIFSQNACLEDCSPSWTFRFYASPQIHLSSDAQFHAAIHPGNKLLAPPRRDSFLVRFATHPGLFMNGYSYWKDINTASTTFHNEYQTIVSAGERVNVCFQSVGQTGCQYAQCLDFDPSTEIPCMITIDPVLETSRFISLNLKLTGTPPFEISWSNDAVTSSIVVPLHDTSVVVYASVTVKDGRGNTSKLKQTIRVKNGSIDPCYFPVSVESVDLNSVPGLDNLDGHMDIIYRDESGRIWTTSGGGQINDASISIEEVTEYFKSPLGQQAYEVALKINAALFEEHTGVSGNLETQRLVVALSHP